MLKQMAKTKADKEWEELTAELLRSPDETVASEKSKKKKNKRCGSSVEKSNKKRRQQTGQ